MDEHREVMDKSGKLMNRSMLAVRNASTGVAGSAKNVCNCRCCLVERAKWTLDEKELETLKRAVRENARIG